MALTTTEPHVLEARPVHPLSPSFVIRGTGGPVTTLELALFRARGRFAVDGAEYEVDGGGLTQREFLLGQGGRVVARAEREGLLPFRYRVLLHDRSLALRTAPLLRRATVSHGEREIATIRARRLFGRATRLEGGEELPLPLRVFILAVVLLRWRRRGRAS